MIQRKLHPSLIAFLAVFAALACGPASAALPQVLNHQGRVAVAGVNFDGNGQFKFALVNAAGTVSYWSNDGTGSAGSPPAAPVTLAVSKGLYSVQLGDTVLTNMTELPSSALEHEDVRLRIWFNDGSRGFQLITPDQRLAAVPYAIHAREALAADTFGGLLAGDVTGPQGLTSIADATVTGKRLGGFASITGLVSADDSLLSAIGKLHGNGALLAPLASPTFTGTVGGITAGMVGLGNVSNTSDANKPVSTPQQAALDLKAPLASPTFTGTVGGITAGMVGLGNVDNTADASKPVSTLQLAALALKAPLASPTFTGTVVLPTGSTAAAPLRLMAGTNLSAAVFGAVEFDGTNLYLTNNSASPTRKALAFADGPTFTGVPLAPTAATGTSSGQIATTQFVQSAIQNVVGAAPAALDTLNELAGALNNDASYASSITNALSLKAPLASPTFTGTVGGISKSMVGLGNVDNTSDGNKPVSTPQLAALDLKAPLASPTFTGTVGGITAGMVGLGNVDNTADANKPVSTLQQAALALKAPLASPTFSGTVGGITAGMVGLGNVDNTSDASKPVSTLQQAALALKAPLASPTFTGSVAFSAGTATTAPIRLATGTNLSTPVPGAVEFDGSQLYITTSPATRKALAYADSAAGGIAAGRLIAAPLSPVLGWGSRSRNQTTVPVLAEVAAVSAGGEHSLALLRNGTVQAWGSDAEGLAVVPSAALGGVTRISAGFEHNLACKSDGTLVAWGASSYGRTAIPAGITTATNVAAGGLHSLALLANGTVRAWGDSTFGQATVPGNLTTVTAIAAGQSHSLALKSNGEVVAWGSDSIGQIAIPAAALSGVTAIAAGWNHSMALKSDGSVLAWGLNTGGQTDVPAGASSGVVQIAAGDTYSLALKSDGTVIAWGYKDEVDPVTVVPPAATQVTQIAAGGYHALALRADTVPVQFARLDHLGRLGIGRTPTTYALEVNGNAWKSTAGAWLSNSDRRIKTDIESISGALERLDQVRLVDFRYTGDYLAAHPEIEDRRYPNVIAQEFAQVFPDDVKGSGQRLPDGSEILQVDTYPLTIYSAAAIQELHRENRLLQKKLNEQESRLRKLEELLKNP